MTNVMTSPAARFAPLSADPNDGLPATVPPELLEPSVTFWTFTGLQRYLTDEPIVARPPSAMYQFRKFAKRNRALVAGAAAVFVVLLAGIAVSTTQYLRAQAARRDAETARDETADERDRAVRAEAEAVESLALARQAQAEMRRQFAEVHAQAAELSRQRGDWRAALTDHWSRSETRGLRRAPGRPWFRRSRCSRRPRERRARRG